MSGAIDTKTYLKEYWRKIGVLFQQTAYKIGTLFGAKSVKDPKVVARKMRMIGIAFLTTIAFVLLRSYLNIDYQNIFLWGFVYFILGLFVFFTTRYLYEPVSKRGLFSVFLLPAIFTFLATFTIHSIFLFELARISYILVFSVLVFWFFITLSIVFLMVNILNVNMYVYVPLSKLAEGVFRMFVLLVHVLAGFLLYILINGQYLLFLPNIFWLIFIIMMLVCVWCVAYRYFYKDFSVNSFVFGLIVSVIFLGILGFMVTFVPNVILVVVFYMVEILVFTEHFIQQS